MSDDDVLTPKNIAEHLVDGITAASLVTLVAYAIVFGFEEGFNAFFQIPADYVAINVLSVFHVLSLVVYVLLYSGGLGVLELLALILFASAPASTYAQHWRLFSSTAILLFCLSNALKALPLLLCAAVVCVAAWIWDRRGRGGAPKVPSSGRAFVMKCFFVFVLLMTPLFYFGFRFAEIQDPRLVFVDDKTKTKWVVGRIFNDEFIAIRVLQNQEFPQGCIGQDTKRQVRLSRDFQIVKTETVVASWETFPTDLNYCLFKSETIRVLNPTISWLLFVRAGERPQTLGQPPQTIPAAART